jgi:hypothetical protein
VKNTTPQDWINDIRLGLRQRAAKEREKRWERNYKWFKGEYDKGLIPVNIVFGICRSLIPQVYFKAPKVMVRPRPGIPQEYQRRMAAAKILESADTYLITQMGLKKTLKLATLDSLLYNVGILKVGYHSVFSEFSVGPSAETQEVLQAVSEMTGEPATLPERDEEEMDKYYKYSYHELVKPDQPWVLRVSPKDFVVPVGTKTIGEAPWCAFKFVKRLDEVKLSPVYKNKKDLRPNATLKIDGEGMEIPSEYRQTGGQPDDDYVECWEIWDKRDGTIRVVADGHDSFLRDEEHELEMTGLPVEILQFNPDGDDFWGISHVDAIAPQVAEYCETRTQEMWHRKINNLKIILDKSMLPPEEVAKIENGTIGGIVLANGDPAKAAHSFTSSISRDFFKNAEDIFADLKVIIGFNRNQGGEFEQSRRTAEEIKTVRSNNQLRDDELRDIIADLLADLFQNKIHPLLFQNWTDQRFVEVTSLQSQVPWIPFDAAKIRGQYDVTIVPDSTLPLNKEQEKQQAVAIFQMFKGDPLIRQDALRRTTIEKFEGMDPEQLMKTPQELEQEQQQNIKMQQMQADMQIQSQLKLEAGKAQIEMMKPQPQPRPAPAGRVQGGSVRSA